MKCKLNLIQKAEKNHFFFVKLFFNGKFSHSALTTWLKIKLKKNLLKSDWEIRENRDDGEQKGELKKKKIKTIDKLSSESFHLIVGKKGTENNLFQNGYYKENNKSLIIFFLDILIYYYEF